MLPSSNSDALSRGFFNSSDFLLDAYCFISPPSSFVIVAFFITNILLLLPLCIFILHHGLQQRKPNQSSTNHNDCFTYHMVTIELIGVLGCFLSCCAIFSNHFYLIWVGLFGFSFTWFGRVFFHVLTCVDRYLAVVHPVLYLSLKSSRGVRIRNISAACAWLLCFVGTALLNVSFYIIINGFVLAASLLTVSFCSISVLWVLIHPAAGKKKRSDQSKLKAFCTIMAILGVLLFRFLLSLLWGGFFIVEEKLDCLVLTSDFWFNVPTSLVLPLLYVHKEHK